MVISFIQIDENLVFESSIESFKLVRVNILRLNETFYDVLKRASESASGGRHRVNCHQLETVPNIVAEIGLRMNEMWYRPSTKFQLHRFPIFS